jgi:hypothetical protein
VSKTNIKSPTDWANAFLGRLGEPDTKTNVANVVGWEAAEGGAGPQFGIPDNDDNYNPINTTLAEPGSEPTNSAGVQSFTSWEEGLDATVSTIQSGSYGYPDILDALSKSAPWSDFADAVSSSSWGTHLSGTTPDGSSSGAEPSVYDATGASGPSGPSSNPTGPAGPVGPSSSNPNNPGDAVTSSTETGFAGVLQEINQWYNPTSPSTWQDISSLGTAPIESVITMIFARSASALLFLGVTTIGVLTLLRGGSEGGFSSGGTNVLEFVNQQQSRSLSSQRLSASEAKEAATATRHTERIGIHTQQLREQAAKRRNLAATAHAREKSRSAETKFKERARVQRGKEEVGRNKRHAEQRKTSEGYRVLGHRYAQHEENRQRAKGIFHLSEEEGDVY